MMMTSFVACEHIQGSLGSKARIQAHGFVVDVNVVKIRACIGGVGPWRRGGEKKETHMHCGKKEIVVVVC